MPRSSEFDSARPSRHVILRLFALAYRYRLRVVHVFTLQALLLALTLGGVSLSGLAIDVIRHSIDAGSAAPQWPVWLSFLADSSAFSALLTIGALVLCIGLGAALLNYSYAIQVGRLIHMQMVPHLRAELYRRLQRLSFRFFDAHPSGAIINRVTRDVQMLRSFVDGVVIQGAVLLLALGVFLAYMLHTHVWLTFVSMALTPLLYVLTVLFSRWARPAYLETRRLTDLMVRRLAETIEGIQVVKVFGREEQEQQRFFESNQAVRSQQGDIFRNVSRFTPLVDLLNHLNLAVLMAYGAVLIGRGEISLGDLIVFAGLLQQFARRASDMANIVNTLQQSLTGARRVFEVLDQPLEVEEARDAEPPGRLLGELQFKDVAFSFHEGVPALCGVSLRMKPGECIGIMGATGSGKSTLVSLVPRFYDTTSGSVLVDGKDVRRLALDELRRQVGIVFQETLLFRDSVANNIAFGQPDATEEQIVEAAKVAGADEFIRQLPDGYQTLLDEGATNLSGGQRQRLAIARALLLQPPILILDDPTTAVDPETEAQVLSALDSAARGRTTLLISSRLATLRRADRIVVLDKGRIVQQGTHEQLLKQHGPYAESVRVQGLDRESLRLLSASGVGS